MTATQATASPSGSRRLCDSDGRLSSSCASCRSPKRARASGSPRLSASSGDRNNGSLHTRTGSSVAAGFARSAPYSRKPLASPPAVWDTTGDGQHQHLVPGHPATSPCRSPSHKQGPWMGLRSQRRRETSVPLLSKTLSHVSLSQSTDRSPQGPGSSSTVVGMDSDVTVLAAPSTSPPSVDDAAVPATPSSSIPAQTPTRMPSRHRINTPAPLITDNLHQYPHTEPIPAMQSFLGSPFASTKPRLYPYELASPTWIAKGGCPPRSPTTEEGSSNNDEGSSSSAPQAVPTWRPDWKEDKDVLPELVSTSVISPPGMIQARSNSGASDDGSCTSASSFFSTGRMASSRFHSRPSFVTLWGDDADGAQDDDTDLSTPNRTLFAADSNKLQASLLMSATRPLQHSSPGTTSPIAHTRRSPPSSMYDQSPTRPFEPPLTRIVTASPATASGNGAIVGTATNFPKTTGQFTRSPIPGYIPRMVNSARKADARPSQAPFQALLDLDDKSIVNQRRISEPLEHSSGDAFAAFLARCGGDRATRSDASPHGNGNVRESSSPAPPSSEADDIEHSPLRSVAYRQSAIPASANARREKLPGLVLSPSTSLHSIKTRLDKLKGTPKGGGGSPSRSQSTRVSASARATRPNLRRGVTEPQAVPQIGTPVSQLFGDDKPSPAAFASTGLVKKRGGRFSLPRFQDMAKGRSWSPLTGTSSTTAASGSHSATAARTSVSGATMDSNRTEVLSAATALEHLEDTDDDQVSPIRPMRSGPFRRSISSQTAGHHMRAPSAASDIAATSPLRRTHARVSSTASSIGGLRRKGSFMFNSAASINSDTVSEKGYSPATPTKALPFSAIQAKFNISTPSPTVSSQQYPFARRASVTSAMSIETTSPTVSPFRPTHAGTARVRQLNRGPIARASNPMLAATFRAHGGVMPNSPAAESALAESYMTESARVAGAGRFERDFTLVQALGSGEHGCVWKVRSKADGGLWAVKSGRPYTGPRNRQRQLEEVTILHQLSTQQHPHVVQYADSWEQAGRLYIRTELADCGDLARYLLSLGDTGGLDEGRVWKMLVELSSALEFIHGNGVLHLDFKPSNILVMRDGRLKVADFGMSMFHARGGLLGTGTPEHGEAAASPIPDRDIEGDREYLCPELLRDVVPGPEADMFSLGILTLEAALNVVLPSNGDAWVKLRNDDFSDIEEHYAIRGKSGGMDVFEFAGEAPVPTVSGVLLGAIQGMMAADPGARMTVQQVGGLVPVVRARGAMYNYEEGGVGEVQAGPALVDEEEGWAAFLLGE